MIVRAATLMLALGLAIQVSANSQQPADVRAPQQVQPMPGDNRYRRQILNFVDSLRPQPKPKPDGDGRGMIDVAFASMQTMQDTITRFRPADLAAYRALSAPSSRTGWKSLCVVTEEIRTGRTRLSFETTAPPSTANTSW